MYNIMLGNQARYALGANMLLVVEDDLILQLALVTMLTHEGYPVVVARSVAEARIVLIQQRPEVVLLDIGLPDGSGFELLREQAAYKDLAEAEYWPLMIVTTGDASLEGAVQALRLGAFDYLTKPINSDLMRIAVQRAIEHQRLQRTLQEVRLLEAHKDAMRATARAAAHHLSQHLTVIMGEAQLVLEDQVDMSTSESLTRIVRSAEQAARVLADLRHARHFVTRGSLIAEPILDLDAAQTEPGN